MRNLNIFSFLKLVDYFGPDEAHEIRKQFISGKITNRTLDKILFIDEPKEDYIARVKKEYAESKKKGN